MKCSESGSYARNVMDDVDQKSQLTIQETSKVESQEQRRDRTGFLSIADQDGLGEDDCVDGSQLLELRKSMDAHSRNVFGFRKGE